MALFYIVCLNELIPNQKLELIKEEKEIPFWNIQGLYSEIEVKSKLNDLYPNGLSPHGIQYLSEKLEFPNINGKDFVPNLSMIEWTFELIRRNHFPNKPSRFESVFGCETVEQAKQFRVNYRNEQGQIYKVNAEKSFKADMNLLYPGASILGNHILAEKYWIGRASDNPFWEILMFGEIEVVQEIKI